MIDLSKMSREELKAQALLVKCDTMEALHRWVRVYLDIDLPSVTIDPISNSNPMALFWEVYQSMESGDPEKTRFLYYAARDSYKTIISSIIELVSVLHFKRNVAHQAAIESQSSVCAKYIKQYGTMPHIKDYVTKASERRIEFTRYTHMDTDEVISPVVYKTLSLPEQQQYREDTNFIQVIIATMQGSNSLHAQVLCQDELDLAPRGPIEEAKMIPTPCRDGKPPIVLQTSSRKFATGLVQEALDNAEETGIIVRHWNLIDVSQPCPASRHLPEEPMVDIYFSEKDLRRFSEAQVKGMSEDDMKGIEKDRGYAGCLKNCRLFAVCRTRLTKQPGRSPLLKGITHVQGLFRSVEVEVAKAQLMCWKPSSYGLIYPNFSTMQHVRTANQIAEMVTGSEVPTVTNKDSLIAFLVSQGYAFYSGMDHGFAHEFSVVTGFKDGNRFFVIDVISAPELELSQKIEVCQDRIKRMDPSIFADPEDPGANKTLSRHFKMRKWAKLPGSVIGGINIIRSKLMPGLGADPQLFFLGGEDGATRLIWDMQRYHWTLDQTGRPSDIPSEEIGADNGRIVTDDRCDALRYVVMNVFPSKKGSVSIAGLARQELPRENAVKENWMEKAIADNIGAQSLPTDAGGMVGSRGRSGTLFWDLS